jgi:hypothetical protein
MRKIFYAALLLVLVAFPVLSVGQAYASNISLITPPLASSTQKNAVILSSLDQVYPMGQYEKDDAYYLTKLGYNVTFLTDKEVTVNFLLTQLNSYSVIIWRTNTYTWKHVEYWYVGELANSGLETTYANDFAEGWMNGNAGIVGISLNFFSNHFTAGMLSNVKLMFLDSSDSIGYSTVFNNAGAKVVVFCNGAVDLGFGLLDNLTTQVIADMSTGQNVYTAVYGAVSPFVQNSNPEDNLDSNYVPPFWYLGDGTFVL